VQWGPAKNVAAAIDLSRSTGIRYAWQRWREEREWAGAVVAGRNSAYEAIWGEAASELGVECRPLGTGLFEFGSGAERTTILRGHSRVDSAETLDAAFDKSKHFGQLAGSAIPVPRHLEFTAATAREAIDWLVGLGGPAVLKPAAGTGAGSGVTSGIRTPDELRRAMLRTSRSATRLQIEEQLDGDEYRVLILDGEILDVVRRCRPRVVGDGHSAIARLVAAENRRRLAGDGLEKLNMLKVDLDSVLTLERQGLSMRSVPSQGESVIVKQVVSQNAASQNETVRRPLGEGLRRQLIAAADVVGIRLAGVDIITADLGQPLEMSGGGVLEVNADPGIHHHYAVADREHATRVAVPILRTVLDDNASTRRELTQLEGVQLRPR
jgi:cyanophycin synthetase